VATNAENKSKNGSDSIIPYDRNRVILTPDGARPHSTYINASFIEGYHNDESFIITQDPLEVITVVNRCLFCKEKLLINSGIRLFFVLVIFQTKISSE
jgi:protein tyrosine phosphatase